MIEIRRMGNEGMWKLLISLVCERRLHYIIMPTALKVIFNGFESNRITRLFISMFMTRNLFVQKLFGHNAYCKKQKHQPRYKLFYDWIGIQFFLLLSCKLHLKLRFCK